MKNILKLAEAYIADRAWNYGTVPGRPDTIEIVFSNPRSAWRTYVKAIDEQDILLVYSVSPENASPDRRAAVAEFITRVNFGLVTACFEMDYSDGEVRVRSGIDLGGEVLTLKLLEGVLQPNLATINRYLPGLLMVYRGEADPATARAECEEN